MCKGHLVSMTCCSSNKASLPFLSLLPTYTFLSRDGTQILRWTNTLVKNTPNELLFSFLDVNVQLGEVGENVKLAAWELQQLDQQHVSMRKYATIFAPTVFPFFSTTQRVPHPTETPFYKKNPPRKKYPEKRNPTTGRGTSCSK